MNQEVIRMQGAYGRKRMKDAGKLKLLLIVVAAVGVAAVTFIGGGTDETAVDVLYAGQADEGAAADDVSLTADAQAGQDAAPSDAPGPVEVSAAAVFVDVCGAVESPSVYELAPGSRVYEAIEAAGGLAKDADIRYINRAAALADGDRVYVPTEKETAAGEPLPASAGLVAGQTDAGSGAQAGQGAASTDSAQININTADSAALQTLNGVGPATAQKIIDYRDGNGPFAKIEDLKNVSGIGDKTFEKLKDSICV
jgi:competence protein ComEA